MMTGEPETGWSTLAKAIFAILFAGVVVLLALTSPAWAHDWYTGLKNSLGWHCCNKHDFKPVRAWQDDDGRWRAIYDGVEYVVPDYAILPDELNQEPFQAHMAVGFGTVRCFLRKAAGS